MTIDPMAAVTSATSSAASPAAGADPAASATSGAGTQNATGVRVADQGAKVDLFDYTAQHQNKPPAIDTLAPEGKAKYLSNPAALGDKVLERLEGLHQRSIEFNNNVREGGSSTTAGAAGSSESTMSGPASSHVAGTAQSTPTTNFSGLQLMFDYAIETTMISNSSSQFVSSVNTLMRGQ